MNNEQVLYWLSFILYAIGYVMLFSFYDWKLALIIFLLITANNIERSTNAIRKGK